MGHGYCGSVFLTVGLALRLASESDFGESLQSPVEIKASVDYLSFVDVSL